MNKVNELTKEQTEEWNKLRFYIKGDQLVNLTRNIHNRRYILEQFKSIFDNQYISNNKNEKRK